MKIKFDRKIRLGEGGFGSVFPGTFQGNKVAVKRVELLSDGTDNEEIILKQLDHPNIIKCFYYETDANFKYFALELCTASLDQTFPQKYKGPKLPHYSVAFFQLASGLEHIHSKNLIHRDIKPQNILIHVDPTSQVVTMKWADFGLSRSVNERGTFTMDSGIKGTRNWFAPEELITSVSQVQQSKQPRGTVKSDVFALGLAVFGYLLLDGQHLYGSDDIEIHPNILTNNPVNIKEIDQSHYALDVIKKMLEPQHGNRITSKKVVALLISIKEKVSEKVRELGQLCIDASLDLNKIQSLIQLGIDVNRKSTEEVNALHLLCANNSSDKIIDAIKLLIQGGIDVNGKDKYGSNALHYLCRYNSNEKFIETIKLLIQLGIDVNEKDKNGRNALHYLCANNSSVKITKAIRLLIIQLGIDVNGKDEDGSNALHYLCRYNSSVRLTDAIKLLITELRIDDANGKNKYGSNALHLLCLNNSSDKLIDAIKLLIQLGIDVNEKDKDGWNALQYLSLNTSSERLIDATKVLIQLGIDVKSFGIETRNLFHKNSTLNKRKENVDALIQLLDKAVAN